MAKEDRILIEVEVNAGKSAEELANVRSRIDALKEAQKALKREMKEMQTIQLKNGQLSNEEAKVLAELNKQYAENAADLKELTAQEKVYTSQIQIATQNDRKFGDSIIELGAQLAQLKQEYRLLSKGGGSSPPSCICTKSSQLPHYQSLFIQNHVHFTCTLAKVQYFYYLCMQNH